MNAGEMAKWSGALIGVAWAAVVILFVPVGRLIEAGGDEGMELTKAMLVFQGSGEYKNAWNDQPSTLTNVYSALFKIFGLGAAGPRFLSLASAVVVIGAVAYIARIVTRSSIAGIGAALFVVCCQLFQVLSFSAMQQMPGMAMAMAGLAVLVRWRPEENRKLLIIGGALIGCAAAVKLVFLIYGLSSLLILAS